MFKRQYVIIFTCSYLLNDCPIIKTLLKHVLNLSRVNSHTPVYYEREWIPLFCLDNIHVQYLTKNWLQSTQSTAASKRKVVFRISRIGANDKNKLHIEM